MRRQFANQRFCPRPASSQATSWLPDVNVTLGLLLSIVLDGADNLSWDRGTRRGDALRRIPLFPLKEFLVKVLTFRIKLTNTAHDSVS